MNQLTNEIKNLRAELLALKQERLKILSKLVVKEFHISVSQSQSSVVIRPKNNVMPLISYYINSITAPSGLNTIECSSVDANTLEFTFYFGGQHSAFDLVLISTSDLEIVE